MVGSLPKSRFWGPPCLFADIKPKLYGLAFALVGVAPFLTTAVGKGWMQNVATGVYAVASASGSIYFALNFAEEGMQGRPRGLGNITDGYRGRTHHLVGLSSMRHPRDPADLRGCSLVLGDGAFENLYSRPWSSESHHRTSVRFDGHWIGDCLPNVVDRLPFVVWPPGILPANTRQRPIILQSSVSSKDHHCK